MTQPDNLSFGTAIPDDFGGIAEFAGDAEDLGFDRLSMGEHVMDGDPPRPTVLSITAMAAAAGATRGIRLLTGIVLIPLYPPVLLAKLVASLDVISGGRLDFGIGIGGQRNTRVEFDAVGVPAEERGRRANEMLDLLPRLWTEDRVSFDGRYYRCQGVTLLPRPVQKPYPPIWWPAERTRRWTGPFDKAMDGTRTCIRYAASGPALRKYRSGPPRSGGT